MLLAGTTQLAAAQERPYEIKVCSTSEVTVIDNAGEVTIFSGVTRGMADSVAPGGPFGKTSFECRGVTNASKAGVDYNSRCTFVDADGPRVVGASAGNAQGWNWKFLGGTAKSTYTLKKQCCCRCIRENA